VLWQNALTAIAFQKVAIPVALLLSDSIIIKKCPRGVQTCDHDLEINSMTLKLKSDIDTHTENEAASLRHAKLRA